MIALEFPPVNTTGCYRYLKFIKYLGENNVETSVVMPTIEDLIHLHPNAKVDTDLLKKIPENVKIIQVPLSKRIEFTKSKITLQSKISHYLNYKGNDVARAWSKNLNTFISEYLKKEKVDIIFVSVPPFSLGVLVCKIFKRMHIPIIFDFRDEWSMNKGSVFPTYFHYKYAKRNEKKIFKKGSAIISVTSRIIELFKKLHPEINPSKFHLITNGFDLETVNTESFDNVPYKKGEKFIIGQAGAYYYNPQSNITAKLPFYKRSGIKKITYRQDLSIEDWLYQSPLYFLKALSILFIRRPDLKNIVEFHNIGHTPNWLLQMIEQFSLESNFIAHGFLKKSENLALQRSFNVLLYTAEKITNGEQYCLSSKIFDYVLMKRPILGFVTEGEVKDFIEKSGCGVTCDPDDEFEASQKIELLIENQIRFTPNQDFLLKFQAQNLSQELRKVIDIIIQK